MRVLITGGGSGLGLAIARACRARGDEVVICGRREPEIQRAASEIGAAGICGDVTADPDALLGAAGPLQGLVHCAGLARHAPIGQWTAADWDLHYAVHVRGPALLSQAFAARCVGSGSILHLSSTLAARPAAGTASYAASKAATLALSRALALELAPRGIRVNALLPGVVPTAMTATGPDPEARLEALRLLHPLGRLGRPEEVAEAAAFLLHAEWITGAELAVDGGLLIG